jgi:DNA replicative helicase MCM subunit Mcm2 (Cdc46/Mcm family)
MLASAQDREDAYERLDSIEAMEADLDAVGVKDEEYLGEHGIDPEAVAAAGERGQTGSTSRRDRVLDAIATLEEPSADAVVEYASDRGVPPEYVRTALEKLAREGTIVEAEGGYRRL